MNILAVTNMYPTDPAPTVGIFVQQQVKGLIGIGLHVEVLLLNRVEEGRGVYFRMAERIREKVASHRYDLVHVMYGGVMAEAATRAIRRIPTMITIHGSDLLGERLSPPLARLSAHVGVLASRAAARRADGVVTVSDRLREALPGSVDRKKVRVIPCGIDLDRFKPADPAACRRELGWSADGFHVLFAWNGNAVKRPELARRAVAALNERGTRAELHEMRQVPYDRVPTWINASDALLLTSMHEGSPTIVKECLASNVPVVSVDVGDVRERIHDVAGCAIVSADPDELATALLNACSARSRSDGRNRVRELSLNRTAERLSEFYREVIAAKTLALTRRA